MEIIGGIVLVLVVVFVLREVWCWILWFVNVRLWVCRRHRAGQGKVLMDWNPLLEEERKSVHTRRRS